MALFNLALEDTEEAAYCIQALVRGARSKDEEDAEFVGAALVADFFANLRALKKAWAG